MRRAPIEIAIRGGLAGEHPLATALPSREIFHGEPCENKDGFIARVRYAAATSRFLIFNIPTNRARRIEKMNDADLVDLAAFAPEGQP